jgi:hypothetical protein
MPGMFFGSRRRNDPDLAEDPHPVERYPDNVNTGNMALDGYQVLAKASPDYQGRRPPVPGTVGKVFQGPDDSFEQ